MSKIGLNKLNLKIEIKIHLMTLTLTIFVFLIIKMKAPFPDHVHCELIRLVTHFVVSQLRLLTLMVNKALYPFY